MSTENYAAGQLLTAAALVTSFANNIGKVGDTATSLQINGAASYTTANGGTSTIGLHSVYVNHDAGLNHEPLVVEDFLTADTRTSGDTTTYGYSTTLWTTAFTDQIGGIQGFNRNVNVNCFIMNLRTQNVLQESGGSWNGVNGFTDITGNANITRPPQFATDQALMAAWNAQTVTNPFGNKPPMLPQTLETYYGTFTHGDQFNTPSLKMQVPASAGGPATGFEQDLQVGNLDDNGTRTIFAGILDQTVRTPGGGMPASASTGFYANAIAGSYIHKGFRTGDNVLVSLDSRSVATLTCVVSAALTAAPSSAIAGALTLQTAPTPPSGGTVLHVGSNGSQGSGIGAFTFGSNYSDNPCSTSNPLYVTGESGAVYQVVGAVLDGSGCDSGYLVFSGSLASGDSAIGATFTVAHYIISGETGHRLSLENSGQLYLDWEPSAFNNQGGHVFHGAGNNVWVGGNLMLGQADGTFYSLIFTPYNGLNTDITYNPITNSLNFTVDGYLAFQIYANAVGGFAAGAGALVLLSTGGIVVGSDKVLGARQTGWTAGTASTNTPNKGAFSYDSATLAQLCARVNAMEQAMFAGTGHGLIGVS